MNSKPWEYAPAPDGEWLIAWNSAIAAAAALCEERANRLDRSAEGKTKAMVARRLSDEIRGLRRDE